MFTFKLKPLFGISALVAAMAFASSAATATEISVVSSGGCTAAMKQLAPEFEKQTGNTIKLQGGPSMGDTPQAIPNRLKRGEPIDMVIMVGYSLDQLVEQGKVLADAHAGLALSKIGLAVKAGSPHPDISSMDALRNTLLNAKSIAYSDSASGVYLSSKLFPKMGIADQIKDKAHMIPADPVGQVVARGDAELGFQQLSELMPVPGIDIVGALPDDAQQVTLFSAGVVAGSANAEAAKSLLKFLASPAAAAALRASGLEPVVAKTGS